VQKHIATWNPIRELWETEQADLFSERQEPYSATWPTSGMTRNGQLLPLEMSAHHTAGSESSSSPVLPTPVAMDAVGARNATSSRQPGSQHHAGTTLTDVFWQMAGVSDAPILPTPRATDGTKGGPNQRGSSGDLMLPSAVIRMDE
jgi:hypothetical protein